MSDSLVELHKKLQMIVAQSNYDATRFFKTGVDSYSAHDQFVGITNPVLRQLAKEYNDLSFDEIAELLGSVYNQYRQLGLFMLVNRYQKSDVAGRDAAYSFYMQHIDAVSNWNLVDSSAHLIVGAHIHAGRVPSSVLEDLAVSCVLWHRRIGIVATWYLIRQDSFDMTISLAEKLLSDTHDLMHKAVGWMLREMGKRDEQKLRMFLDAHGARMPRTMYRYAIERLPGYEMSK